MIFMTAKKKQIVGARVQNGSIYKDSMAQVFRKGELLFKTKIANLRSFDKNMDEIKQDNDCGIQFPDRLECQEGDIIVCIRKEKK